MLAENNDIVIGSLIGEPTMPDKRFVDPKTKEPGRYHSAICKVQTPDGVRTWLWPRDEQGKLWALVTRETADAIDAGATARFARERIVDPETGEARWRTSITLVAES